MRGVRMGAKLSAELPLVDELNEEAPVDLVEISGVIKWFDASKGYGFIVPDGGLPDVLCTSLAFAAAVSRPPTKGRGSSAKR